MMILSPSSNIYEASRRQTADNLLVKHIIGAAKVFDSVYMKRGRKLEA